MIDELYYQKASLLLKILPLIGSEKDLALKGGTAINFFVRNMPRLSIDIDLCFLPLLPRHESFEKISAILHRIIDKIKHVYPNAKMNIIPNRDNIDSSFLLNINDVLIKIEINYNFRGFVYPPVVQEIQSKAQQTFNQYVKIRTLSQSDLYGSKMCAALDRQHPRDFFDILYLLKNGGFDENIKNAFIVYLISHNRPMIELLNPRCKDLSGIFETEFEGMTTHEIHLEELESARQDLIHWLKTALNESDKRFLLSVKENKPEWDLLNIPHVKDLPSVQWKLLNISRMSHEKHQKAVAVLKKWLNL
ncbi:MAG TPA: hypothetical protein DCP10_04720 [Bacteroidales bacterium]|nr:hypothetical protein [Bacteroidales bacterium]